MNVQLTINETAKLSVLSQEQILERIEGTPQRIPADVLTELETFINGQNRTAAQRLLTAINAFANPEEGFRVWQEYYNTGDQPALRQAQERPDTPRLKDSSNSSIDAHSVQRNRSHGHFDRSHLLSIRKCSTLSISPRHRKSTIQTQNAMAEDDSEKKRIAAQKAAARERLEGEAAEAKERRKAKTKEMLADLSFK
jgi:hypothetical protein